MGDPTARCMVLLQCDLPMGHAGECASGRQSCMEPCPQCGPPTADAVLASRPPEGGATDDRWAKLAALKPGWDSYGSLAISPEAIERAQDWHACAIAVPMSDGGVQVEWHGDGWDVEVAFHGDGTTTAWAAPVGAAAAPGEPSNEDCLKLVRSHLTQRIAWAAKNDDGEAAGLFIALATAIDDVLNFCAGATRQTQEDGR